MSAGINETTPVEYSHADAGDVPVAMEVARFRGRNGVEEVHLMARPTEYASFGEQLEWLRRASGEALDARSAVLRRFFCSDISNQANLLGESAFSNPRGDDDACAVSCVGQPPGGPAKVAMWAYHVVDPRGPVEKRRDGNTLTLSRGDLSHLWTCGVVSSVGLPHPTESQDGDTALAQTTGILAAYDEFLCARHLSLADNAIRTWLFLRDIDSDYEELARARREYFAQRGLTPTTHYIASTGIAGTPAMLAAKVSMDAYAIAGVQPAQIAYIKAPDHLSPTHAYGVTFERATTVSYRDRKHVFISGTASIDGQGDIVHPGDVSRQLDRTLENIAALLRQAGVDGRGLAMLIAYLRDPSDAQVVRNGIRRRFGEVPLMVVAGAICRPGWLVEVEALAIVPADEAALPAF